MSRRPRTDTVAEIKEVARRLLVSGGPAAISLRAIGREVGVTAPALYRYFPSLDALVEALAEDLFAELTAAVRAARDDLTGEVPLARLQGMARAFRRWSLGHPREFGLMFGGALTHCDTAGFAELFLDELTGLYRDRPMPAAPPLTMPITDPRLQRFPAPAVQVFLSAWSRVYGLVSLEALGHLRWAVDDLEPLFERELAALSDVLTSTQALSSRPWFPPQPM